MIPLAKHTAQVLTLDGSPIFDPIEVRLSIEETWTPRATAEVLLHTDKAKQLPERVLIRMRATFGSDMSIAAITAWAGGSVGAITARVGGSVGAITRLHTRPWNPFETTLPLSAVTARAGGSMARVTAAYRAQVLAVTAALRTPGGAYLPEPPQVIEYLMHRRDVSDSPKDATVRVSFASADVTLHDYRRTIAAPFISSHTSLRALVLYVLDTVSGELNQGNDVSIQAGTIWAPGQTAWEFIAPVLEATGWQLYADEFGRFTLSARSATIAPVLLDRDKNLIEWQPTRQPVTDSAVVEYTGTDPATFDVYAPTGSKRPIYEKRDSSAPARGAARELALRAEQRARSAEVTAVSLYALRPLHRATVRHSQGEQSAGTVESVSFEWPRCTMTAKLRDLTTV